MSSMKMKIQLALLLIYGIVNIPCVSTTKGILVFFGLSNVII